MPPGASARPHYHEAHETAILRISAVPSPVRAVVARTDPNEQESVVLLDDAAGS
jgi:uncharacterized RmlC-like cupin family protein